MRWLLLCACVAGCARSGGLDITGDDTDIDEDTTTDTQVDTEEEPDPPDGDVALTGRWVSKGADVADLLAGPPGYTVQVDAEFEVNGEYTVTATSEDGTSYTFTGTWSVDESTTPATLTNTQLTPYATTATGIWTVDDGVLTLDIVDATLGSPATPAGGFGSSSAGDENVQIYRRP